jgi:hypothetical protein
MFDKCHVTRLGTFTSETDIKKTGAVCFEIRHFHDDNICKLVETDANGGCFFEKKEKKCKISSSPKFYYLTV